MDDQELLRTAYDAFNARDLDAALATMHADVSWPNGWEGGTVHGRDGVREYWTRQWAVLDPRVDPIAFTTEPDGRVDVTVRQVVRDRARNVVVAEGVVHHVYTIEGGAIRSMEIRAEET